MENQLRGLFPGPTETDEQFSKRASTAKMRTATDALDITHALFNARPDWVEVRYDKKGLLPWEGAAAWIEESPEHGRKCTIQLKPSRIARLYPQHEMIAHEMVHAMRLMFDEDRFEEILAFRTSKNRFRRYFGPLFSRPIETKIFLIWMIISWALYLIFDADYFLFSSLLPLGLGVFRLYRSQRIFSKALANLAKVTEHPLAVALRLTDVEIEQFSKWPSEKINSYFQEGKDLRLQSIFFAWRRQES